MITAKPILMSAPMVLATLREIEAPGTGKTQTRRIIKQANLISGDCTDVVRPFGDGTYFMCAADGTHMNGQFSCPYGKPGDLLYVRETYAEVGTCDPGWLLYRASGYENECRRHRFDQCPDESAMKWTPSIHMPRWASRLTLEITDIRIERLQDISEADARAEGILICEWEKDDGDGPDSLTQCFSWLWESLNGPDSWAANPWVWVVEFRPHLINVDQFIEARAA
ncbi:hypothetical protein [Thalassospira xiamenensis]|uniref:hypothetical protein n=1 Tax=Thalassospira xiamenensis TaxID=220697 RepID=UPI003AA8D908